MDMTDRDLTIDPAALFGEAEALQLLQLQQLEIVAVGRKRDAEDAPQRTEAGTWVMPERWELARAVRRYLWQEECIERWFANRGRGTVKVVTGAGKTLLALWIAARVQNSLEPELRLVIVVPTIVLMHQWYEVLLEHGNIPAEAIGRLGGGYDEDFGHGRRVLIAVLTSASRQLPGLVKKAKVGRQLLLVADECHRTGAKEMSQVFKTQRRWSLGLSATPERDGEDAGYDESVMGAELGPIVYQFTLADAVREGLVPKFTIHHFGLPLSADERQRYDALTRSISDAMSQLRSQRDAEADGDFFAWARAVASRNKGDLGPVAKRFISDTTRRRELLNRMQARHQAVVQLIRREFDVNPDARIILFHESIDEVQVLFAQLYTLRLPVVMEHSELPGTIREKVLEAFRRGTARIIVSARSLIEGFNVPAVDVGIVVASSGSVRQRIQSMGRVLRRHRGPSGEEKTSCMYVLYAADTADEGIYGKIDWDDTTGVDRNRFYRWDPAGEPVAQDGPPRTPLPTEMQIDPDALAPGAKYPGQYEGAEWSCDSQRNICDAAGRYALETGGLAEEVLRIKGAGGRFRVTPKRRFVLVRVPADQDWETVYVTRLRQPMHLAQPAAGNDSREDAARWQRAAQPGDPYPFGGLPLLEPKLRYKQKGGGQVSKKVRRGEAFARQGDRAEDPVMGADASRLAAAIRRLHAAGRKVGRFMLNAALHAYFREAGQLYFICALEKGLEFPPDRTTTISEQPT